MSSSFVFKETSNGQGMLLCCCCDSFVPFEKTLQRPRNAIDTSGVALSRALYDLLLLLGWCCTEAALTRVCAGSLLWCLPVACRIVFLRGFNGESHVFCRPVLTLRLRWLSTRAGSRVIPQLTTTTE